MMKTLTIFVTFFVTVLSAESEEPSSRLFQAQPEPVDLGLIYDFFTNDAGISRFQASSIAQFFFNAIGYLITTFLWTSYRGDDLPSPPNTGVSPLEAIMNSLYNDQNAATVIALATGYAISTSIVYILLSQLGNPQTPSSKRKSSSTGGFYDEDVDRLASVDDITTILDGVFSPSGAINFLTLQSILQVSIFMFWTVMRLLPKRSSAGTRKQFTEQFPTLDTHYQHDGYNYGDYYSTYNEADVSF